MMNVFLWMKELKETALVEQNNMLNYADLCVFTFQTWPHFVSPP